MSNIWFGADYHFGHAKILTLKEDNKSYLRHFKDVEEMNNTMVDNHNSFVSPQDKIYMLGDIALSKHSLHWLKKMNGTKILIKGNHDRESLSVYAQYFKDVRATHLIEKGFVLSHVPLHPDCLESWGVNIHGHLHSNKIKCSNGVIDRKYFCVSMEQTDYSPISFEEIKSTVGYI